MRYYLLLATFCFGLAAPTMAEEPEFPYNAIVLHSGAKVHSGPGDTHYATHELNENALVQVFRHDPGGWCAIRPPEKSFSLIPQSAVKIVGEDPDGRDVAEVLANGTQAWVGTALGPVEKPLWQVKLKKGEQLSVVGEASWPHPSGKSVVWLQIQPPAGEYRWIRMSDLQLPPAEDEATKVDYSEPPAFKPKKQSVSKPSNKKPAASTKKTSRSPKKTSRNQTFKSSKSVASSSTSGWKASTRPIPKTEQEKPTYSGTFRSVTSDVTEQEMVGQVTFLQDDEPSDPRFERWDGSTIPGITDVPQEAPDRFASLESMEKQTRSYVRESNATPRVSGLAEPPSTNRKSSSLIEIEERLSEEILKEPQMWNMTELKFATERAKAVSNDPVERLALQHVLDKIAKCDQLRKGYQQATPFANSSNARTPNTATTNSVYDASGWLKRLASSSGSMDPTYVLQDSLGNVTHEVVGTTGMNLGQYVDKQVGVIGRRGTNYRLKLKHVTVDRVVVLR